MRSARRLGGSAAAVAAPGFGKLLSTQRDLLLLEQEYWSQAVRDPALRERFVARQRRLRTALGEALVARVEHLGGPQLNPSQGELMATIVMSLADGLTRERLIDPPAVPDRTLGEALVWLYKGLTATS